MSNVDPMACGDCGDPMTNGGPMACIDPMDGGDPVASNIPWPAATLWSAVTIWPAHALRRFSARLRASNKLCGNIGEANSLELAWDGCPKGRSPIMSAASGLARLGCEHPSALPATFFVQGPCLRFGAGPGLSARGPRISNPALHMWVPVALHPPLRPSFAGAVPAESLGEPSRTLAPAPPTLTFLVLRPRGRGPEVLSPNAWPIRATSQGSGR